MPTSVAHVALSSFSTVHARAHALTVENREPATCATFRRIQRLNARTPAAQHGGKGNARS